MKEKGRSVLKSATFHSVKILATRIDSGFAGGMGLLKHSPPDALSTLCVAGNSFFNKFELKAYEDSILSNRKATEQDASRFFSRFPKFLLLGSGAEVRRETVLFGPDGAAIGRVDFFRRSFGQKAWDIIELKHPNKEVFTGLRNKHPNLSKVVYDAINQAKNYREFIISEERLRRELNKKGIVLRYPRILVIAGKKSPIVSDDLAAKLLDRISQIGAELFTYDGIWEFAKEHYYANQIFCLPLTVADPHTDTDGGLQYRCLVISTKRDGAFFEQFQNHLQRESVQILLASGGLKAFQKACASMPIQGIVVVFSEESLQSDHLFHELSWLKEIQPEILQQDVVLLPAPLLKRRVFERDFQAMLTRTTAYNVSMLWKLFPEEWVLDFSRWEDDSLFRLQCKKLKAILQLKREPFERLVY